jgi:hypothetical protein
LSGALPLRSKRFALSALEFYAPSSFAAQNGFTVERVGGLRWTHTQSEGFSM